MKKLIIFITFFVFYSCTATKNTSLITNLDKNNCNQENSYDYLKSDIPRPIYNLQIDTALITRFNPKDLNLANAIGILDLLSDYINKINEVKECNSLQSQIDLINIRQEINNRIDLTSLEISSVTSELDCEEERINQISSYLKEREMQRETRLTVGSIILGSLTAIVAGVLVSSSDPGNISDYIGISVGLVDAAIGVMILTNKRKVELEHSRNVLREIWLATETSSVYPPSIWYYLNYKDPDNKNEISLREQLIENWKVFGQVSSTKNNSHNKGIEIYFSDGGSYSSEQLENRANMYDQIESTIKLMKQDLRNLTLSIANIK